MADIDDDVDFKRLEKELAVAVAKDEKYQRENDAKFRAIHQKVASYEEFRDIVEASHLTPLSKDDKLGGFSYQKWNAVSSKSEQSKQKHCIDEETTPNINMPQSSHDFIRTWKRQCATPKDKFLYLISIETELLLKFLMIDCPMGEIILALYTCEDLKVHGHQIVDVLKVMYQTKRFSLQLDFLSKKEKQMLGEIFNRLNAWLGKITESKASDLNMLTDIYKVSLS